MRWSGWTEKETVWYLWGVMTPRCQSSKNQVLKNRRTQFLFCHTEHVKPLKAAMICVRESKSRETNVDPQMEQMFCEKQEATETNHGTSIFSNVQFLSQQGALICHTVFPMPKPLFVINFRRVVSSPSSDQFALASAARFSTPMT